MDGVRRGPRPSWGAPGSDDAGLLECRRRAPARGRRLRAGRDGRGRPPGGSVGRGPGRARRGRPDGRRRPGRAARRTDPTSCCWSVAPTAATPRSCGTTPASSRRAASRFPWCWPGNVDAARRRGCGPGCGRRTGHGHGQRAARDRPAGPGARAAGDPRGLHQARHRRQGPVPAGRLPGHGPRGDSRRGAGRGRAAGRRLRRDRRRGRRPRGRRRRGDDRRLLGGDPAGRGRGAAQGGRRGDVAQPHRRG